MRGAEMRAAARRLGAGVDIGSFTNHPSDVAFDPANRGQIRAAWEAQGEPVAWLSEVIERVEPDLVLTLDPGHGYTGHVEHAVASELVQEAVRSSAESPVVFLVLNRYEALEQLWLDPSQPTEEWDATRDCGTGPCVKLAVEVGREHESQLGPTLGLLLLLLEKQETVHLRRVGR